MGGHPRRRVRAADGARVCGGHAGTPASSDGSRLWFIIQKRRIVEIWMNVFTCTLRNKFEKLMQLSCGSRLRTPNLVHEIQKL